MPLEHEDMELTAALALKRSHAMEEATPRVSIIKAHARKVAGARQIGEGGSIVTLGANDRYRCAA